MYIVIAYVRPFLLQVPHDHGIYAESKAGAIQVPERFLNQSDPARKAAAERAKEVLAAKVTKPAAAKQTEAKKKTKKKAAAVKAVAAEQATAGREVLAKAGQAGGACQAVCPAPSRSYERSWLWAAQRTMFLGLHLQRCSRASARVDLGSISTTM